MSAEFLRELSNLPSRTISQLQQQIKAPAHSRQHSNPTLLKAKNQPEDLNVVSPFYPKCTHHPKQCKCPYHKKQLNPVKKLIKCRTEGAEQKGCWNVVGKNRSSSKGLPQLRENQGDEDQDSNSNPMKMLGRRSDVSMAAIDAATEQMKRVYFQYLKTLPNVDKFKRHTPLDCHNQLFEKFLRENNLTILKGRRSSDKYGQISQRTPSQRTLQTAEDINNSQRRRGVVSSTQDDDDNQGDPFSMKDLRNRRKKNRDNRQSMMDPISHLRNARGYGSSGRINSSSKKRIAINKKGEVRSSFFTLVEDKQLLRSLCERLVAQNQHQNANALLLIKRLVDSDMDIYSKALGDISSSLEKGELKVENLSEEESKALVKIVLGKMRREAKLIDKAKDHHYEKKNSMMEQLYKAHGWKAEEKPLRLAEFWKIRREKGFDRRSNLKVEMGFNDKRESSSKNRSANKKVTIKESVFGPAQGLNGVRLNTEDGDQLNSEGQQFVVKKKQPLAKKGVLVHRSKTKKITEREKARQLEEQQEIKEGQRRIAKQFNNIGRNGRMGRRVAQMGKVTQVDEMEDQEEDDEVMQLQAQKKKLQRQQERQSDLLFMLKNQVLRHMEMNKNFLKQMQDHLRMENCDQLVIGLGDGILTKKRKIRAIQNIISQNQDLKKTDYYDDMMKYLEIYDEYCTMVVGRNKSGRSRNKDQKASKEKDWQEIARVREEAMQGEGIQIDRFIEDLKKERELKFIDLKLIDEEEVDLKEELILMMPDTIKSMPQPKQKSVKKLLLFSPDDFINETRQRDTTQDSFVQVGLTDRFNMECTFQDQPTPDLTRQITQKIAGDFDTKIANYRRVLGLNLPQ